MEKMQYDSLEEHYKYQVLHRCNFMQMSSTTQINFLFRYQNKVLFIVLSFIHLISIKQIKTTGY